MQPVLPCPNSEVGAFSCAARISPVPTDPVGRELGGKHCPAPPAAQRFVDCSGRAYEINVHAWSSSDRAPVAFSTRFPSSVGS